MKAKLFSIFLGVSLSASSLLFAEGGASRENSLMQTMVMIGIAIAFFYFILWRPERKRRKEMETKRNSMKKGDEVTVMGIIGTISKVENDRAVLRMVDGAKIEVYKSAITDVRPSSKEVPEE